MATDKKDILIHVGTGFGDDDSPTQAVLRLYLARDTGVLSEAGPPISIDNGTNPGWLSRYVTIDGKLVVYIGLEDNPGMAQAYQVVDDSNLQPMGNSVSTEGMHPCYCQLDKSGKWLLSANYSSGTVSVMSVLADGSLGKPTDSKKLEGRPIQEELKDRQEASHAHCIIPHPSNNYVVACDLGLSKVFVYEFDSTNGTLKQTGDLTAPIDAGSRHCCWDATGETLFIVNELNYTVTVAAFHDGSLKEVQSLYLLRESDTADRSHHRGASDVALHPNGKFLYVGCRSTSPAGLICMLNVEGKGDDCKVSVIGHESTRGEVPRNFKLIGNHWMVVGNQDGKSVVSYAVDAVTGQLEFKSEISTAPYKACNIASPEALNA